MTNNNKLEKQILLSAQHGNIDILKSIYEQHNIDIHWSRCRCKTTGDTPLHLAAQENKLEIVEFLCEIWTPSCLHIVNKDGKTALHDAAQFHSVDVLEYLISKGADVNMLKRADWTPLMLACAKLSTNKQDAHNCIKILIQNKANKSMVNKDGWTCLHLSARLGDVNVFKIIWSSDISELLKRTKNGRTVLHITALHGHVDLLQYFLLNGVTNKELDTEDNCGNTVFHDAILSGNLDLVRLLEKHDVNIYKYSKSGLSSLHLAAQSGMPHIMDYLIKNCDFDVNIRSKNGKFTPLHCAYRAKQHDAIELLKILDADEFIADEYGRLPNSYLL